MVADYHDVPKRPKADKTLRETFNDLSKEHFNGAECGKWTQLAIIFNAIEAYVDFKINAKSRK